MALSRPTNFRIGKMLHTFASFSWCDQSTPAVVGGKDAMIPGGVNSWFGHRDIAGANMLEPVLLAFGQGGINLCHGVLL
jgi:hypothetical protein